MRKYEVWKTCRQGHSIMISKNPCEMCRGPLKNILLFEIQIQYGIPNEACYF